MTGDRPDGSPSEEARAFMATLVPDRDPVDFDRIGERRQEARAEYRAGAERAIARHRLELEDVTVGGVPCTRVVSAAGTARGTLLYVFGGGFIVGDPYSDLPIVGALAERCQVDVVAPLYRLAPEHPAPAAGDDCFAVWAELADRPDRLLVAGESAGGNLALLTVQRAVQSGIRGPAALALLSPAVDLRVERELFGTVVDADPTLSFPRILDVARAYAPNHPLDDPLVSPLFGSMDGIPPTIITTGTRDLLLGMSLRLDRTLRRAGVDVECRVWDGMWHVFEYYDDYPEAAESLAEIARFLDRY